MKWSSVLSAATLVASALAGPISPAKREEGDRYILRVSTTFEQLNGKYLSCAENLVGIYDGGAKDAAQEVVASSVESTDSVILRTWPIGIVDHALGLSGDDGYLDLRDVTMPSDGTTEYSWKDFKLADAEDGHKQLLWGEDGAKPGWIAAPVGGDGQYKIKNYDMSKGAWTTQDYIPIQIVLEPVEQ